MSENNTPRKEPLGEDEPSPIAQSTPSKTWVQFEDETENVGKSEPAVIPTENVHVLERSFSKPSPGGINSDTNGAVLDPKPLRNVELPVATVEPIRQGFVNGDVIVTLLPVNSSFPWITPARFRPELVPEELMAQGLTLTVEEYVQAMELLVNDFRFTIYNICYKRVLVVWVVLAFLVLFGVLFSNQTGPTLFGLGIGWLMFNAAAIFLSMWVKFKLTRNLEKCLAHVNKQLLRHKIVIALDDRGKISCHKVNLCFLYMDSGPCINHLQTSIDQQERDQNSGWEQKMDITANDIVIQGSRTTRLSRKQERATLLYLRYIARWGKEVVRGYLVSPPAKGGRHCHSLTCPCQYIDEHLYCKPPDYPCSFFFFMSDRNIHGPPSGLYV
ncbi:hypothetical protein HHI36_006562 [Cryptolaemus montrouzieri]|uniref:Transmembrane protein 268 n=1 Tax=Cryptolaemus montrouzieri TaxID=559131 RepID=A0ABD2NXJ6_9CUCU